MVKHSVRSNFSIIIRDENRKKLLGKIIKNFKMPTCVEDLILKGIIPQQESKDIETMINTLYLKNVLIKPSDDIMNVYIRSIFKSENPLSQCTIGILGIIGVGYLGFRILRNIIDLNIKKINFCDERKIENVEWASKLFSLNNLKSNENYVDINISIYRWQ